MTRLLIFTFRDSKPWVTLHPDEASAIKAFKQVQSKWNLCDLLKYGGPGTTYYLHSNSPNMWINADIITLDTEPRLEGCPVCDGEDKEHRATHEFNKDELAVDYECLKCGHKWTEYYRYETQQAYEAP